MAITIGEDGLPSMAVEELAHASPEEIDAYRRAVALLRIHPLRVCALRAADVTGLSSDPRLMQLPGAKGADAAGIPPGRVRSLLETTMLMSNGTTHQRRRGAFTKTFAHPVVRRKREQVRAVADQIVDDLPRGKAFDFLDLCASRLPAEMIATVLGLPIEQSPWFARQVYSLSRCLTLPYDINNHDEVEAAAEALYHFVAETLAERRETPRDDFLSMLATDGSARALSPEELIYQVMSVIIGGSDTTRSAFNMAVGRLLQNRALWNEVQANRDLIPAAVNEALRLEPPVGGMPRYVPEPITIGELNVEAGQLLNLLTLSAMRDETCFARPEAFDLHREDHILPHPVFGGGAHRCLGEMLARIELEEGLAALMDGAPDIELVEMPRMLGNLGIRRSTPLIARIP